MTRDNTVVRFGVAVSVEIKGRDAEDAETENVLCASVRGFHPLKTAKDGSPTVGVLHAREGPWATQALFGLERGFIGIPMDIVALDRLL